MVKRLLVASLILILGLSVFVYAWAGEASVTIDKGWNLVYGFMSPDQLDGQVLEKSNIKAIYGFVPTTQQYVRMYPNPNTAVLNNLEGEPFDFEQDFSQTGFWVYSDKAERTKYWLNNVPVSLDKIKLYKGWNFVGITPKFQGYSFNQIKGNCNVLKVYTYSESEGGWLNTENYPNSLNDERALGEAASQMRGLVVKVSNNCNFGVSSGGISAPPAIPS
jgi:hypothetical protein